MLRSRPARPRALLSRLLPVVCVLFSALPASAQRLAFGVTGSTSSTFGIVDLATGIATPATADEAQLAAVLTSDGQYAVRVIATGLLGVRHMPTGMQTTLTSDFVPRLAHPRRHTLFGIAANAPARFDERGLVRWDVCGVAPATAPAIDLTLDGGGLYAACPNGDLVGIDTESGAEIRRLAAAGSGSLALTAAASEVIVSRGSAGSYDVLRLDLATGQPLATRHVVAFTGVAVLPTPDHNRFLLAWAMNAGPDIVVTTTLVDAATLTDVRTLGSNRFFSAPDVSVSPDGRQAFVLSRTFSAGDTATQIDLDTGATLASASVPGGYSLGIRYAPAPLPPALAPAQISGGTVTLSWALPATSPMATGYRVEVGTGPGLGNLGAFSVGATGAFSASGVPPGRYNVRIRALNYTGVSTPSNEIVVDVP